MSNILNTLDYQKTYTPDVKTIWLYRHYQIMFTLQKVNGIKKPVCYIESGYSDRVKLSKVRHQIYKELGLKGTTQTFTYITLEEFDRIEALLTLKGYI